jgi:Uma2 family endonuclease
MTSISYLNGVLEWPSRRAMLPDATLRRIRSETLTVSAPPATVAAMTSIIDAPLKTRRWRRVEYDRLVELGMFEGERLELLDGLLVVREPQKSPHAATVAQAADVLRVAFGAGWHVRVQAPVALDDDSEPEPDAAVVAGTPRDYLSAHPSTPALVVEVADSSLRLDRRLKSLLYARAGLGEYWIVNLVDHVLEVHREPERAPDERDGWRYRSVTVLRPPDTVTALAAPHARIAIADLLP